MERQRPDTCVNLVLTSRELDGDVSFQRHLVLHAGAFTRLSYLTDFKFRIVVERPRKSSEIDRSRAGLWAPPRAF